MYTLSKLLLLYFGFISTFLASHKNFETYPPHFDSLFDHLIIISMKHSSRFPFIQDLINKFDTKNYSIIGVNGTAVAENKSHPLWKVIAPDFLDTFTAAELGCSLSHRAAYEYVIKNNFSHALILEDDIHVHHVRFLKAVEWYRPYISPSWQIIHWWCRCTDSKMKIMYEREPDFFCNGAQNESALTRAHVAGYLYTTRSSEIHKGTVAYEINSNSAKLLLDIATPVYTVSDEPTGLLGEKDLFLDYVETSGQLIFLRETNSMIAKSENKPKYWDRIQGRVYETKREEERERRENSARNVSYNNDLFCNKSWPDLEIVVPVYLEINSSQNYHFQNIFLRSFLLFWPQNTVKIIRVVLDEEIKGSFLEKTFIIDPINLAKLNFGPTYFPEVFIMHDRRMINVYKNNATDRQQYKMMMADMYATSAYIALVEPNVVFHSYVHRDDIFLKMKPIVHGVSMMLHDRSRKTYRDYALATFEMLKLEAPIFTSYSPVVIKRNHFSMLRIHIERMHKMKFDEVFYKTVTSYTAISVYVIICSYVFWNYRIEYDWHVLDIDPGWDGFKPQPFNGQWSDKSVFEKKMLLPHRLFIANHLWNYDQAFNEEKFTNYLATALCWKLPLSTTLAASINASIVSSNLIDIQKNDEFCARIENKLFYPEMFHYEGFDESDVSISPDPTVLEQLQFRRRIKVQNCTHKYLFL